MAAQHIRNMHQAFADIDGIPYKKQRFQKMETLLILS